MFEKTGMCVYVCVRENVCVCVCVTAHLQRKSSLGGDLGDQTLLLTLLELPEVFLDQEGGVELPHCHLIVWGQTPRVTHLSVPSSVHLFIHAYTYSFIHSSIQSLRHSFTHALFIQSSIHSHSLFVCSSFIHSLIRSRPCVERL